MFDSIGSETEKFYNNMVPMPVGTVLTFAQLADVGFNPKVNRRLIYAVNRRLLEQHKKMLISKRSVGYKMAEPSEQMTHAWKRRTSARRQISKAVDESVYIDTSKLTADERKTLMDRELHLRQQLRGLRSRNIAAQNAAHKAIEKVQESVKIQKESLDRIDELIVEAESIRRRLKAV